MFTACFRHSLLIQTLLLQAGEETINITESEAESGKLNQHLPATEIIPIKSQIIMFSKMHNPALSPELWNTLDFAAAAAAVGHFSCP